MANLGDALILLSTSFADVFMNVEEFLRVNTVEHVPTFDLNQDVGTWMGDKEAPPKEDDENGEVGGEETQVNEPDLQNGDGLLHKPPNIFSTIGL